MAVDHPLLPGQNIGVDTPLVLYNTQVYFPLSSLLLHKSHKWMHPYVVHHSSACITFAYCVDGHGLIPNYALFLISTCIMALENIKLHLFSKTLHLFIFFLPLFTFKNERSAAGFPTQKIENTSIFFNSQAFTHCQNSIKHIRLGQQDCRLWDCTHRKCNENTKICDTTNIKQMFACLQPLSKTFILFDAK
jgi:hypothetical protein